MQFLGGKCGLGVINVQSWMGIDMTFKKSNGAPTTSGPHPLGNVLFGWGRQHYQTRCRDGDGSDVQCVWYVSLGQASVCFVLAWLAGLSLRSGTPRAPGCWLLESTSLRNVAKLLVPKCHFTSLSRPTFQKKKP